MAYAKATLQDLLQSIADQHDGGNLTTNTGTLGYWTRLLNRAQEYAAGELEVVKKEQVTVASGIYSLGANFRYFDRITTTSGVPLNLISQDQSVGMSGLYYWITGNFFDGYVLNVPVDGDYILFYPYRVSPMSATTDVCIIPEPEAVWARAYADIRLAETDPLEDAQQFLERSQFLIERMKSDKQKNDQELAFAIPPDTDQRTSPSDPLSFD